MNEPITMTPEILGGKPVVRDTRVSVEFVLGLLAGGWTIGDIVQEYDRITREDVEACLNYASGSAT